MVAKAVDTPVGFGFTKIAFSFEKGKPRHHI